MAVVIDDRLLLDVLAGATHPVIDEELARGGVYTTSCWYYRLGRAVNAGSGTGSLSGRLAALGPEARDRVLWSLRELPDEIGLLTSRTVVPVMVALRVRRPLNMLNAEALAVALLAGASVMVTLRAPLLESGATDLGVAYQLIEKR